MGFDPVKRAFFVEALGEERVEELERRLFGLGKDLERRGVGFKGVIEHIEGRLDAEIAKSRDPTRKYVADLMERVVVQG